jgi:membrane glycosyltransferase
VAMADLLPQGGANVLEAGVLGLFALLFCWVSAGFWTATMGFVSLLRQSDPHLISRSLLGPTARHGAIAADARTAIVMPICNEDVDRVFAGLRATWESLAATGQLERFDFFVLSDSNDPDLCVAELAAWQTMAREVDGFGRLFYRRRERRVKKKSGNIDDFLRRWGANYRYMVVMDADSVMSGACLSTLVRMMEARPDAGIIQTAPRAVGRDTLFARMQQFASRLYGPLFTAGLHYWQLDESHYWGHNAIIRVAPFMKHCMLAPLPGTGSLSGPIMSHDFVEAALMRRAGWGVWIAHDLPGSYEELPPNLLEELGRDRRWCHGNLMNFRLLFARGIRPVHRALFFTGAMAYASGPLWLGFLLATTAMLLLRGGSAADTGLGLPYGSLLLSGLTMLLLLLPKLFAITLALVRDAAGYGGTARLLASSALEIALSLLLAPVRMVFHARFVLAALFGWKIEWRSPARSDQSTPWRTALAKHGVHALAGLLWLAAVAMVDVNAALWTLPVAAALMLAVPASVLTSRPAVGRKARVLGLFLVPEELVVPRELRRMRALAAQAQDDARRHDWVTAIVDPRLHAVVAASAPLRRSESPQRRVDRVEHVARALLDGPAALDAGQRRRLLRDRLALVHLHRLAWSHSRAHDDWRSARADWQRMRVDRGLPSVAPTPGSVDQRMLAAAREHRAALQRELALAS